MSELYEMKQRPHQPVQDLIQMVQKKATLIDLPEDQIIETLMIGFYQIWANIIRSDITSIADVIKEASISEQGISQ